MERHAMTSLRRLILGLAALLLLAWLLRPRETTEIPWSIRLFEPDMTPEWHPQDRTTMIWGEAL